MKAQDGTERGMSRSHAQPDSLYTLGQEMLVMRFFKIILKKKKKNFQITQGQCRKRAQNSKSAPRPPLLQSRRQASCLFIL